jgi:iron(III) transport system permease protein
MRLNVPRIDSFTALGGALVAVMSVVILALLGTVLVLSFTPLPASGLTGPTPLNYLNVLANPQTVTALVNSVVFAIVALVVALGFGLPMAWLVECTDVKGKGVVMTLMLISLLIPGFAAAAGWLFLLHPRIGLVNVALMSGLGLKTAPFNILSLVGMGWVEGLSRAPIAFLMTSAAFRAMDRSLEEAALTAGAPHRAVLTRIILPLIRPSLLSCAIYILMIAFGSFDVPAIIGWGNRILTFSTYIYLLTNPQDVFPGYGPPAALGGMVLAAALLVVWWARSIMSQAHRYAVISGKAYRPRLMRLGAGQIGGWVLIGLYLTMSLVLPLLVLGWASLLPYLQLPSARSLGFMSLNNFRTLPWDLFAQGLKNTAFLALVAPPIVLVISFFFSWLGFRTKLRGRMLLDQIAFMPHAIPHIVLAMGLLLLALYVVQPILPIYGTVWALLLAFTVCWLSYGTRVTNAGLLQIHKELEESARVSGASTWVIVGRVVLPLLSRGLLLAWVYIAILTARELTLSVLLSTPGNMTLPVVIWSLWLNGGLGRASAALVCFLGCMLPLIAAYVFMLQRPATIARKKPEAVSASRRLALGNAL